MAAFFFLKLDKTPPTNFSFLIDGGAALTAANQVDLTFSTDDTDLTGYTVKVWGSVTGSGFGTTEAVATWIEWPLTGRNVALTSGDGLKTINARARDRVGNETTIVTRTITVDSAVPVVTLSGIGGASSANPEEIGVAPGATIISTKQWQFQSDRAFVEYQVRVGTSTDFIHTAGTPIGMSGGSSGLGGTGTFSANTSRTCILHGADLNTAVAGVEAIYVIKVFVKTAAGVWSV